MHSSPENVRNWMFILWEKILTQNFWFNSGDMLNFIENALCDMSNMIYSECVLFEKNGYIKITCWAAVRGFIPVHESTENLWITHF